MNNKKLFGWIILGIFILGGFFLLSKETNPKTQTTKTPIKTTDDLQPLSLEFSEKSYNENSITFKNADILSVDTKQYEFSPLSCKPSYEDIKCSSSTNQITIFTPKDPLYQHAKNMSIYKGSLLVDDDEQYIYISPIDANIEIIAPSKAISYKGNSILINKSLVSTKGFTIITKSDYVGIYSSTEREQYINNPGTMIIIEKVLQKPRISQANLLISQNKLLPLTINKISRNQGGKDIEILDTNNSPRMGYGYQNNIDKQQNEIPSKGKISLGTKKAPSIKRTYDDEKKSFNGRNLQQSGMEQIITYEGIEPGKNYTIIISLDNIDYTLLIQGAKPFSIEQQNEFVTVGETYILTESGAIREDLNEKKSKTLASYDYQNVKTICGNHPLNHETTIKAIEAVYDRENITISSNTEKCITVTFMLDPEKEHQIKIDGITSIFGETGIYQSLIIPHELPESEKIATVMGQKLNILANDNDQISLGYKNMKEVTLSYKECFWKKTAIGATGNTTNYYEDYINLMTECPGSYKTKKISTNNADRWKMRYTNISAKELFGGKKPKLFKISAINGEEKFFLSTSIGVITKHNSKELYTRLYDLKTGNPITANVSLQYPGTGGINNEGIHTIEGSGIIPNILGFEGEKNFLMMNIKSNNDETVLMISAQEYNYQNSKSIKNPFFVNQYSVNPGINSYTPSTKIYGFTDRILYKANDRILISGWLKSGGGNKLSGKVTVGLTDPEGVTIESKTISTIDELGGFTTEFILGNDPKLGSYGISYEYTEKNQEASNFYSYIEVQSYKKSSISLNNERIIHEGNQYRRIAPTYYFGQALNSFNATLTYSYQGDYGLMYDRSPTGESYYFGYMGRGSSYSGGSLKLSGYDKKYFDIPLNFTVDSISTFKVDATIIDNSTNEVVLKTLETKIYPSYLVGIKGRNYDRYYDSKPMVEGKILIFKDDSQEGLKNYGPVNGGKLKILIYHKPYGINTTLGVDGERYYSNGYEFILKETKEISLNSDGTYSYNLNKIENGEYLVRVIYNDKYENQKYLYISDRNQDNNFYGQMNNNYLLTMNINDKEYEENETVTININPYIKGARVLINVERDGKILAKEEKVLDGKPLTIKAEKERFPNAHINVMQIVSEDTAKGLSGGRTEPRFLAGYKSINISPKSMRLKYKMTITDTLGNQKSFFEPGEKVKVKIKTMNANDQAVKTRLTVSIIDKALIDIMDQVKKPLETFYTFTPAGFLLTTNMHILYKSLKVFVANGEKGGDGVNINDLIKMINPRKNFLDVAFRNGGFITNDDGIYEFETTLPDNLTTRVVEIIGVSREGYMSADRSFFTVNKKVSLLPNLPKFLTMSDKITIPLSVKTNEQKKYTLGGALRVGKYEQKLDIKSNKNEYFFNLDLTNIPVENMKDQNDVEIILYAKDGNQIADSLEINVPFINEGFIIPQFETHKGKTFSTTIKPLVNSKESLVEVTVSQLPIKRISQAMNYLLHYPYGCTEQLMSTLYPIIITKDLYTMGILNPEAMSGEKILLKGNYLELKKIIDDTLNKVMEHKKGDGLFGYRISPEEKSNIWLSLYVYNVLLQIKSQGHNIDEKTLTAMERSFNKMTDKKQLAYYRMIQSIFQRISYNPKNLGGLLDKADLSTKIFVYVASAYRGKKDNILENEISASLQTISSYRYGNYFTESPVILKARFARGAIKNDSLSVAKKIIEELYNMPSDNGYRGRSTQENINVILAITDYIRSIEKKKDATTYTITINDKKFTGTIDNKNIYQKHTIRLSEPSEFVINLEANHEILTDIAIESIPKDLGHIKEESHSTILTSPFTNNNIATRKIGDINKIEATYELQENGNNVAIAIPVPANTYIVNPALSRPAGGYRFESKNEIIFEEIAINNSEYSSCYPSYYAVYDNHLFIYYESMNKGTKCAVRFDVMKTHDGQNIIAPMKLREMYNTNVRGIIAQ